MKLIKLKNPSPVYLKGNEHAILLLHSFTGTVRDVKDLAKRLNGEGFTAYVPSYAGHGLLLEDFLQYDMEDWWQNVVESYEFLKKEGYTKISAVGVSLGGLFTLKLLETYDDLEKSVVMSVPQFKNNEGIYYRLEQYGLRLNQMIGLSEEKSARQLALIPDYDKGAEKFCQMIEEIMKNLSSIQTPLLVMHGHWDDPSYAESARFIYEQLPDSKEIKELSEAGHLMTLGRGQAQTEEKITAYLCHKDVQS